ncbi:hypothetical protein JOM56_002688 [Amanita muscaria]
MNANLSWEHGQPGPFAYMVCFNVYLYLHFSRPTSSCQAVHNPTLTNAAFRHQTATLMVTKLKLANQDNFDHQISSCCVPFAILKKSQKRHARSRPVSAELLESAALHTSPSPLKMQPRQGQEGESEELRIRTQQELYPSNKWKESVTNVSASTAVEGSIQDGLARSFTYFMDERDKEWLDRNNEEGPGAR